MNFSSTIQKLISQIRRVELFDNNLTTYIARNERAKTNQRSTKLDIRDKIFKVYQSKQELRAFREKLVKLGNVE